MRGNGTCSLQTRFHQRPLAAHVAGEAPALDAAFAFGIRLEAAYEPAASVESREPRVVGRAVDDAIASERVQKGDALFGDQFAAVVDAAAECFALGLLAHEEELS